MRGAWAGEGAVEDGFRGCPGSRVAGSVAGQHRFGFLRLRAAAGCGAGLRLWVHTRTCGLAWMLREPLCAVLES